MKTLLSKRVHIAWLLLILVASGAAAIIWIVAVRDAPPTNAVLVETSRTGVTPQPTRVASIHRGANPTASAIIIITTTITSASASATAPRIEPSTQKPVASAPTEAAIPYIPAPPLADTPAAPLPQPTPQASPATPTATTAPTTAMISVYVSGAVNKPGVYSLPEGSRIGDAVAAAGGALTTADLEQINLAQKLEDADHISIYRKDQLVPPPPTVTPTTTADATADTIVPPERARRTSTAQATPGSQSQSQPAGPKPPAAPRAKVDINTATAADLEQLPYIGPAIAARIIADREKNGPFQSIEDLTRVSGIKEGTLARIRNYITVGP